MPSFQCTVCGADFEVPQAAVDKYPGWQPKYCREHSQKKTAGGPAVKRSAGAGGSDRGRSLREENLTVAQVLSKYGDGPRSGVFTDGSAVPNPGPGGGGPSGWKTARFGPRGTATILLRPTTGWSSGR